MNYEELLQTTEWHEKRKEILSRDFHRCRNCNATEKLQIHHRQYHYNPNEEGMIEPWLYENQYLITLCEACHKAGHQLYTIKTFKL